MELEQCLNLLVQFFNSDNEIRSKADQLIYQYLAHDPQSFCPMLFTILQNSTQISPITIQLSLILLKRIYRRAIDAYRTNDQSLSYRLISAEETQNMIDLIVSFFGHESTDIQNEAAYLLGQISIYFALQPEKELVQILPTLITNIDSNQAPLPSIKAILFQILEEPDLILNTPTIQQQIMNKMVELLNEDREPEFKAIIINIITLLIPFLSNILLTPEDTASLLAIMTELTKVPQFKLDTYEFWVQLSKEIPVLFAPQIPELFQMSIEDINSLGHEFLTSKENSIEIILIEIFQLIFNISEIEFEQPELTSQLVQTQLPQLLPFFFQMGESFVNPDDDEFYSTYSEICSCLTSFLHLDQNAFQVFIEYGMQSINSTELNKKIFGLFLIEEVTYNLDDTEESLKFFESCFAMCTQILSQPAPSQIIRHAMKIVYNSLYFFPTSFPYFELIPIVANYLSSPIFECASILIQEIASSVETIEQMNQIFELLFQLHSYNSINCAYICLNNLLKNEKIEAEVIQSAFALIIIEAMKLCDALLKEPTPDIEYTLTPLLKIISLADNSFFTEENYQIMIQICNTIFEQFENPICLTVYSKLVCISKDVELLSNLMQKILGYLDSHEYESLTSSSLDSLLYLVLNEIDVSPCLGDLISSLLVLIESVKLDLKLKIVTILNCLFSMYPEPMQPFIPRIMALFNNSMIYIDRLQADEAIHLHIELFKATGLLLQFVPQSSNEQEELLCDFFARVTNCYLTSEIDQNRDIDLILLQTLHLLVARNGEFAKSFLTDNEAFVKFTEPYIGEENQDEEILALLSPILALLNPEPESVS